MAEGVTNENKSIRECFGWAGAVINCPANGWNSSIMSGMGRMARSGGEQCGPLSRTTSLAARRLEAATHRDTRRRTVLDYVYCCLGDMLFMFACSGLLSKEYLRPKRSLKWSRSCFVKFGGAIFEPTLARGRMNVSKVLVAILHKYVLHKYVKLLQLQPRKNYYY